MENEINLKKSTKLISVILGALAGAFAWHIRGSHGFGAMWGVIFVSTVLTLLVYFFYGKRERMSYELIPVGMILAAVNVPAWGEVNTLMKGTIVNSVPIDGKVSYGVINGWHGVILMLMTGFTLMCLYSIFFGSLFSKRKYKLWQYAIFIAVFIGVTYLVKATISHNILSAIAPEIPEHFTRGLEAAGNDLTPKEFLLKYLTNDAKFKKIAYGRAYCECINHIAEAIASVVVLLVARVAFKDRVTAVVSLVFNIFSMIGFVVGDIALLGGTPVETSIIHGTALEKLLPYSSWSLWEYITGFFMGLGAMLIIALLPKKLTAQKEYRVEPKFGNKIVSYIYNLVLVALVPAVVPIVRAQSMRISAFLLGMKVIGEKQEDLFSYIFMGVIGIAVLIPIIKVVTENMLKDNMPGPFKMNAQAFARKSLPLIILVPLVGFLVPDDYMIWGVSEYLNGVWSNGEIISFAGADALTIVTGAIAVIMIYGMKKSFEKKGN